MVEELRRRVTRLEQQLGEAPNSPESVHVRVSQPAANLESRLGSQYLNRIGILALLVGVAFFLHWAFVNNWLGPATLVILGLLGGLGVIALGQSFQRQGYPAFGRSLNALGIGLLYLAVWAAFQVYQLVPAIPALGGMIAIAAATAAMAIVQGSETLTILACVGGFATPLLLASPRNQQYELFVYVFLLSVGMLVTLIFRGWQNLLLVTLIGCCLVDAIWYWRYYRSTDWLPTFLFSTILFAMFIAGSILVGRKVPSRYRTSLMVPPLASFAYLLAAHGTLESDQVSLVAGLLGAALVLLSQCLRQHLRVLYFSTGIACLALAVPLHFEVHWTTSALWLTLGILLIVLGIARNLTFARWNGLALLGITILKIFVFDLVRLAPGYRIVALSILGVAMLAISFLYQRFRARQN